MDKLNRLLVAASNHAKLRDAMAREDIAPSKLSAADFAQKVQRDHQNWGVVIRATGFTLDQ